MNRATPVNKTMVNGRSNAPRYVNYVMTACFVLPICYLVYNRIAEGEFSLPLTPHRVQADYKLMILQCSVAALILHLPALAEHLLKVEVPDYIKIGFSCYLFCAVFLGEVFDFYHVIPFWDSVLHICSGVMLGMLGAVLFEYIGQRQGFTASPLMVALFACCFSIALGTIWELYEFAMDGLMNLNMQKTILMNGEVLAGHSALADTMKDLLLDTLGAGVAALAVHGQFAKKEVETDASY